MNTSISSSIFATSVGVAAWRAVASERAVRVIGVTTRGLFLLAPPMQIIFVSFERYRSPLTITLDRSGDPLRAVEAGAEVRFSNARLIFPATALSVSLAEDKVWQCPPPVGAARPRTAQRQTLQAIVEGVLEQRGDAGLAGLLPNLLGWPDLSPLSAEQYVLLDRLMVLRRAVRANDNPAIIASLLGLIGQGRGLTPSGDDVSIGLLLMLARSQRVNSLAGSENMLKHVVEAAYQKTTTISANLIECAASGQGDERLIAMVDGILTGAPSIDKCVEGALDWGSSSGIDALAGMAVAL
jgi:hypothetical protein